MLPLLFTYYIATTLAYYLYGITPLISWLILIVPFVVYISRNTYHITRVQKVIRDMCYVICHSWYIFIVFTIDSTLLATLFLHRTDTLLISPWQALPAWFFLLFALSTFLLFISYRNLSQSISNYRLSLISTSLHLFVMYGVAAILYKLGFGFDAFIHRATEVWIQAHGFILPKTPYYIGQYSFVVWLSDITQIPVFYIDVYLVPILAAITLPVTVTKSLKAAWNISYEKSFLALWLIPFIPFLSFNLTTPYNLAVLFSLLAIFTLLPVITYHVPHITYHKNIPPDIAHYRNTSLLLSFCALITHLLIGAPIMVFTIAAIILKKIEKNKAASIAVFILSTVSIALLMPVLFTLNNYFAGAGLPILSNPFTHLSDFIALFQRPYWYASTSPLRFELLYAWERMIIPLTIVGSFDGFYIYAKEKKTIALWLYPLTAVSLFVSAWFLRSWITFHDVVSYEQGDYPARLIRASLMFLLPFGMYLASRTTYHVTHTNKGVVRVMWYVVCAITLMLSLYFSYPQRNVKARFPGYNVTADHFKAVEWINENHRSEIINPKSNIDYVVLADQITSAAALTDYSFAKYYNTPNGQLFYYSIPTGGPLYQLYGKMIYEGQKREYMTQAMDLARVNTGYFVVNSYWANSDKIIAGAKATADDWQEFDDGKIWVFGYYRK